MSHYDKEEKQIGPLDTSAQDSGIRVWVDTDPRSVLRLAPEAFQKAMLSLPDELKTISESELKLKLLEAPMHKNTPKIRRTFTPMDMQLRLSFWLEYERAQAEFSNRMLTGNIIRGIMTEEYLYQRFLKEPLKVAFILCPPVSYTSQLSEAVNFGLERLREILSIPFFDSETGKVDVRAADLVLKTTLALDMRKNGAITQKIQMEGRMMSVSVKAGIGDVNKAILSNNMADIDKRLAQLEKKEQIFNGIHPDRAREVNQSLVGQMSQEEWDAIPVARSETLDDTNHRGAVEHGRSETDSAEGSSPSSGE